MTGIAAAGDILISSWPGTLVAAAIAVGLLAVVIRRWGSQLPLKMAPWYRTFVTAVVLVAALVLMSAGGAGGAGAESLPVQPGSAPVLHLSLLAVFVVATILVLELFFRGVVYSRLKNRSGVGVAILGSAVLYALVLTPAFYRWPLELGLAACAGILLAGARWVTGSIVPGLVAQGVLAVSAAMFIVLMGFSAM
jgi:membrane protease YdiL (CAAX protease family)